MNTFNPSQTIDLQAGLAIDSSSLARLRMEFLDRGAAVLGPPTLDHDTHSNLLNEAIAQRQNASWSLVAEHCPGEISQRNLRAHLGPYGQSFLSSASVLAYLGHVTGYRLAPSWSASCYTYYDGPGQHMGEHCDKKRSMQDCFADLSSYHVGP